MELPSGVALYRCTQMDENELLVEVLPDTVGEMSVTAIEKTIKEQLDCTVKVVPVRSLDAGGFTEIPIDTAGMKPAPGFPASIRGDFPILERLVHGRPSSIWIRPRQP